MTHSALEQLLEAEGRELLRRLLQAHLAERMPGTVTGAVRDAAGQAHTHQRTQRRGLESVFGTVEVIRTGYSGRGLESLHPLDAELNLPAERYSHTLRRRAAELGAAQSFDAVAVRLQRDTAARVPKRQVAQLLTRAATDFDAFYQGRPPATVPEVGATGEILVLSSDGKGVPLLKADLRDVTREAAAARQPRLRHRRSKGEKPCTNTQSATAQSLSLSVLPHSLTPKEVMIDAGDVTINVRNLCKTNTGVIHVLTDLPRLRRILQEHPSTFRPFLTGKMLLNNQSFRELFRIQTLKPDLKLRLRSLTLLFTDLKGSTALYDQTGDVFAYNLVQEHYKILTESVRENAGAVIKTMGDAIMATFSSPLDGVKAALEMMDKMGPFNSRLRQENRALGLKIGLHEGAALAVNAEDRLDYFGQTVNIAARVQALAQAHEICVTEQVFQADGVRRAFADKGYQEESRLVSLKGVGQPANVYQLRKHQLKGGTT